MATILHRHRDCGQPDRLANLAAIAEIYGRTIHDLRRDCVAGTLGSSIGLGCMIDRQSAAASGALLLLAVAMANPALAQTPATAAVAAGSTQTSRSGAVVLPSLAAAATTSATASATAAITPTSGGGSAAGGFSSLSASSAASTSRSAPATATASNPAPAWLLCPPPGAVGSPPFVVGTDLSCAP